MVRRETYLIGCLLVTFPGVADFTLARRGESAPCVVQIATHATALESHAADELVTLVRRMTGVELPIVTTVSSNLPSVRLSVATKNQIKPDGFMVSVTSNQLTLVGGSSRGLLFGVYDLFERYGGCAWYSSRREKIPIVDDFKLPDLPVETHEPAFDSRTVYFDDWNSHPDLAIRNKLNVTSIAGIPCGDQYQFDSVLGKCHTFSKLMPASRWYATHPEYFSEVGGRRLSHRAQLCLSNPEVRRICTEEVLKRIAVAYPLGIRLFGVSQDDWGNPCNCKACAALDQREGSPAASIIAFVNAIAQEVAIRYPDVTITTLAYGYSRRPPRTLRPAPNVQVCLCTIECDFSHPLISSRSIENRYTRQAFRTWGAYTSNFAVWDYVTDFSCGLRLWPVTTNLLSNLSFYHSCGVRSAFAQGGGRFDDWAELKAWLLAKGMWDPSVSIEPLLTRWFTDNYGPASKAVRAWFDLEHRQPRDAKRFPMGCFELLRSPQLPDAILAEGEVLMDEARYRAAGTPYAADVAIVSAALDFTYAMRGAARPDLRRKRDAAKDEAHTKRQRDAATRILALAEGRMADTGVSSPKMVIRSPGLLSRLAAFVAKSSAQKSYERCNIEDDLFEVIYPQRAQRMKDSGAGDGSVLVIPAGKEPCNLWYDLGDVKTDPELEYAFRIRVKTTDEREKNPQELLFSAGVYNRLEERMGKSIAVRRENVVNGEWLFHIIGVQKIRKGDFFWSGVDPDHPYPSIAFDRLEIARAQ